MKIYFFFQFNLNVFGCFQSDWRGARWPLVRSVSQIHFSCPSTLIITEPKWIRHDQIQWFRLISGWICFSVYFWTLWFLRLIGRCASVPLCVGFCTTLVDFYNTLVSPGKQKRSVFLIMCKYGGAAVIRRLSRNYTHTLTDFISQRFLFFWPFVFIFWSLWRRCTDSSWRLPGNRVFSETHDPLTAFLRSQTVCVHRM